MDYYEYKYLKYKSKYINLLKQKAGYQISNPKKNNDKVQLTNNNNLDYIKKNIKSIIKNSIASFITDTDCCMNDIYKIKIPQNNSQAAYVSNLKGNFSYFHTKINDIILKENSTLNNDGTYNNNKFVNYPKLNNRIFLQNYISKLMRGIDLMITNYNQNKDINSFLTEFNKRIWKIIVVFSDSYIEMLKKFNQSLKNNKISNYKFKLTDKNIEDFQRNPKHVSCLKIEDQNVNCCDLSLNISNCLTQIGEKMSRLKFLLNDLSDLLKRNMDEKTKSTIDNYFNMYLKFVDQIISEYLNIKKNITKNSTFTFSKNTEIVPETNNIQYTTYLQPGLYNKSYLKIENNSY